MVEKAKKVSGIEKYLGLVEEIDFSNKTAKIKLRDMSGKFMPLEFRGDILLEFNAYFPGAKFEYIIDTTGTEPKRTINVLNPEKRTKEYDMSIPETKVAYSFFFHD